MNELASWWVGRMLELVPRRLRRPDPTRMDATLVRLSDSRGRVCVLIRRRGQLREICEVALNAGGMETATNMLARHRRPGLVLLQLPGAMLLERHLVLPEAALRHLDQALAYEMDRFTPFGADEVVWDWMLVRHDRVRRQLHLRLSLVPKAGLGDVLPVLAMAGLPPARLAVPWRDGALRLLPLERDAAKPRRPAVAVAAATCAALALAVLAAPFALRLHQIAQLDGRADELRPVIAEVDDLRRRLADTTAEGDVFAAEAARVGSVVHALATLTAVLPDDTHLTALTLRQGRMNLAGRSAGAARLITAMSASSDLRDPAFLAPVTRGDGRVGDSFSIRAELGR